MSTAGPSIARDEVAHLARLARLDLGRTNWIGWRPSST